MIRHCALFRFKPDTPSGDVERMLTAFLQLKENIPGIASVVVGANVSPEGLNRGFDHGIIIDLHDAASRDEYLSHPAHLALAAELIPCLDGGLDGVIAFDLEFEGSVDL